MKRKNLFSALFLSIIFCQATGLGQGYNSPLIMQGLNNARHHSAVSASMGGITVMVKNDVSQMFSNPASLSSMEGFQASFGMNQRSIKADQSQQWYPLSYYSNFSLLMEGLTGGIPDPDTIRNFPPNAGDSVQRPFDDIGPGWGYSKSRMPAPKIFFAVPFSVGGVKFAGGLGMIEYLNLDYYYQNNNMLSPDFGSYRNGIFILPTSDRDVDVRNVYWYQSVKQRQGAIYGYGGALSGSVSEEISVGASALVLYGETDDFERSVSRGVLRMHRNYFGLYSFLNDSLKTGTSRFKGTEFTFSAVYSGEAMTFGISVKPPFTIGREYDGTLGLDTVPNSTAVTSVSRSDEIEMPWRGTIGLGISLRENVSMGIEYEYLPYGSASYSAGDFSAKPFLDASSFRFGIEYRPVPLLSLRGGYYNKTEVFEPEGNFNSGEPASASVYTCGAGLNFSNVRLNLAYEYSSLEYEDKWSTNVNINEVRRHSVIADVLFNIPW